MNKKKGAANVGKKPHPMLPSYVLEDITNGQPVHVFGTEVQALEWYGGAMRVFGSAIKQRLILKQRRGFEWHILYSPMETYGRAMVYY